ncbi:hypothetical protein TEA_015046 [Camellia sinensis var. sinensis]|uniref:Arginine and glutamate-rich protein 1 n=1 Tax=Camellia sinensis var. sinensis TaxID=542762 RepID=A0A4V3WMV2_CAMSN|nr:hypothetical protein TEA_015046 [Camellia sinensis var. sinensis]
MKRSPCPDPIHLTEVVVVVVEEIERWLGIGICRGRRCTGEGIRRRRPLWGTGIAGEAEEIEADLHILIAVWSYSRYLIRLGRRSQSISPRRHKSRSPTPSRRKTRSPTPRRYKRQRSINTSLSPISKSRSPSSGSIGTKSASEKLRKEEEKKRRQQEAEMKLIEEETAKRVEEAIRKKVEVSLNCEEIKLEVQRRLEEGRKKLLDEVAAQLEKEKEAALIEARRKEAIPAKATTQFLIFCNVRKITGICVFFGVQEQARKEKEELERMIEENRRKVEEAQRREALEQQRREEERYRELEELQRQKEEALRRKKQQEEEERANQMKLLGKNKSRPKLSFALGLK